MIGVTTIPSAKQHKYEFSLKQLGVKSIEEWWNKSQEERKEVIQILVDERPNINEIVSEWHEI